MKEQYSTPEYEKIREEIIADILKKVRGFLEEVTSKPTLVSFDAHKDVEKQAIERRDTAAL